MISSATRGGQKVTWGAVHNDKDGGLISRQISIEAPVVPTCLRTSCLWRYLKATIFYVLVVKYHEGRTAYAEANRHKEIPEKYRAGEPAPQTIWQAISANIGLILRR